VQEPVSWRDRAEVDHHVTASLGLPVRIDDRAADWFFTSRTLSDSPPVPGPFGKIADLADGAEHLDLVELPLRDVLVPDGHKRAEGRWRGVEVRDAELLANLPEAATVWPTRNPLVHDGDGAEC